MESRICLWKESKTPEAPHTARVTRNPRGTGRSRRTCSWTKTINPLAPATFRSATLPSARDHLSIDGEEYAASCTLRRRGEGSTSGLRDDNERLATPTGSRASGLRHPFSKLAHGRSQPSRAVAKLLSPTNHEQLIKSDFICRIEWNICFLFLLFVCRVNFTRWRHFFYGDVTRKWHVILQCYFCVIGRVYNMKVRGEM